MNTYDGQERRTNRKHGRKLLIIASAVMFLFVYPALIIGASHKVENHSRAADKKQLVINEHRRCVVFNDLTFTVNKFHGTLRGFLKAARDARTSEIKALKGDRKLSEIKSVRIRRLIIADSRTVKVYRDLLSGLKLAPYNPDCAHKRANPAKRKKPS